MVAVHLRILPEHQRKGLWGTCSEVLGKKYRDSGLTDGSCGYVSVDNGAMQRGFETVPNKWPVRVHRAQLQCEALAGQRVGRSVTPEDAPRIVALLNGCHEDEEMYLPYTIDSLAERLERAPKQYSWERVWITERAVVGVWPSGESIAYMIDSPEGRIESRRGLVLDYGFDAGAADEFEQLLRAWCGWLADRGFDKLSIFTSERSNGYERVRALATEIEAFDVWTPGIDVPPDAERRRVYTDQVYF